MSEIDWESRESAERYDMNCDHQFQKGKILIEMMKIKKGDIVLDIGCGTGRQAINVSGIIGSSGQITGIDPASYRIELSRRKFEEKSISNARFLVGQAEDLGFLLDNSVDYAYLCSSFHWIDDKKTALLEIYRVLRPGGKIGMTTLDRDSPNMKKTLVESILEKYHISSSHEWHKGMKRVNASELRNLLTDAGFTRISIEPKNIPRQYSSAEELFRHLEEKDSHGGLLKDVSEETREKIRKEIIEELEKTKAPTVFGYGNITHFAIAAKPDEI